MLTKAETLARDVRLPLETGVEVLSVATAVPQYTLTTEDAARRAQLIFPHLARLESLYTNTGVDTRYAVHPTDWYHVERSWEERTASFQSNALELLEKVTVDAVAAAGLEIADIDAIVVNTITGLAVPSLDARLMNKLPFSPTVERLPIFGIGCGGGVAGLSRAARLAQAKPDSNVLFLTVDLCSLCMRVNDPSIAMFVSAALFGDGAAAVVLSNGGAGASGRAPANRARVGGTGDYFWSQTEHIMGWDIKNDGFGVVLSPELPTLMRERLGKALGGFLEKQGLTVADFDGFLFHPGGRKVLETAEEVLNVPREMFAHSWDILREYGNMSSATAIFVLARALAAGVSGRYLLAAFGPGFSAYFVVLDL
jgi:alkylresorcinol/alkylpyrone synthase